MRSNNNTKIDKINVNKIIKISKNISLLII